MTAMNSSPSSDATHRPERKERRNTMRSIPLLDRRRAAALFGDDTGAATAEYAITTMAIVAELKQN
ncbi:DUF4244 domain-containing protein [Microbacterium oxydans]|nr:DUF4244 domain-containing protein [Microbacterium oxydans]